MSRAIVTFSRGWHALAITRSLGRQGIDVYCGEEAPFAPCFFSKYCAGSFQHPSVAQDPDGFLVFMEKKIQELKPPRDEPYVLIPTHKETWLFAKHRQRFEPHIKVPLTSYENMAKTHDKGRLAELAEELGITIPTTHRFTNIDQVYRAVPELRFPVFLKVREGAAGVGLKKCATPEELTAAFREFVKGYHLEPEAYPLVQEFVDGEDYCVTALFDNGRCVANMTYHNVRRFPRGTGAGAVRETVELPEAEQAANKLLSSLNWHGIAQLDFRKADGGPAYLIELNPRFFGGLPQSLAANVDYPYLLFRIACGEKIEQTPEIDYSTRTEAPITGLLATLDEIAHDERALSRLRKVAEEFGALGHSELKDLRLQPFWHALKQAANPKDIKAYLHEKFAAHQNTINDVIQSDDPAPMLGVLFPIAMMLKHGKLSVGLLTSEQELPSERPRRRFRDLLLRPRWTAVALTFLLFAAGALLINAGATSGNIGSALVWPAESIFGPMSEMDRGTITGALRYTGYHAFNLLMLYVLSAIILRERPRTERAAHDKPSDR